MLRAPCEADRLAWCAALRTATSEPAPEPEPELELELALELELEPEAKAATPDAADQATCSEPSKFVAHAQNWPALAALPRASANPGYKFKRESKFETTRVCGIDVDATSQTCVVSHQDSNSNY